MTKLQENFDAFDAKNPQVYNLFKIFANEIIARGYEKYSVASIIERIRWETSVKTTNKSPRISNNHRAYYARKFMADFPEYDGIFRTRATL